MSARLFVVQVPREAILPFTINEDGLRQVYPRFFKEVSSGPSRACPQILSD